MKLVLLKYSFILIFLVGSSSLFAQNKKDLWIESANNNGTYKRMNARLTPKHFKVFDLSLNDFKKELQKAPKRIEKSTKSKQFLSFPNEKGELEEFEIFEASILSQQLQNEFPSIKSFVGKSLKVKGKTVRFSMSNLGLNAMVLNPNGSTIYIDPYEKDQNSYMVYSRKGLPKDESFECKVEGLQNTSEKTTSPTKNAVEGVNDGVLRTFRLAIATTGEYANFQLIYHGISSFASENEKKEAVLAAINITMTRVNGIFERDLSLNMQLVDNTKDLIFLDANTDGFTNDNGFDLIDESQAIIDATIGVSAYDIGHTFSTGGGGLAELKSPCTSSKAKGITGSSFPVGDAYNVDYVAHEMGHQFGANHTFNSTDGSCGGGNRNSVTSVEPGSGSTIMAYAGLCAPDNIQAQGDDYFHLVSINEMYANISTGFSTCASTSETNNNEPALDPINNYTIPISTPFVLDVSATDADGDVLTYTWEQLDTEFNTAPPTTTETQGPVFRSLPPSVSSKRYFPNQSTVLAGQVSNTWEALPSVARTMNFGVNVRDNNANGGQNSSLENTITFDDSSGPFVVTSQASSENWNVDELKTITWNVANTNNAPVNCSNVNILLSTDGGFTFPITLATAIPNNGSANITVPNVTTTNARIKIEGANTIFYAVNLAAIAIQAKEFTMQFSNLETSICKPANAVLNFTYNTFLNFNEETTFSANGNPTGTTVTFNPAVATTNNTTVEVTISDLSSTDLGNYEIEIIGTSNVSSMVKSETITLNVYDDVLVVPTPIVPVSGASNILKPYTLGWNSDINDVSYTVQIATDNGFTSIVEEVTVSDSSFNPSLLEVNTEYYWRVKAENGCGESAYSTVFNFTTANESCTTVSATDTPISIPDNSSIGATSILNISQDLIISEVKVEVNINHPYIQDIGISLTSPSGVIVLLSVNNGDEGDNYTDTVFDDGAAVNISQASAPFTGDFRPQIPLELLKGTSANGDWKLKVEDSGEADTGTLQSWNITICGTPVVISDDDDNDGVSNADDLCLNTTAGALVDDVGCFMLPANNFDIETIGKTCPDKDNGQIIISPQNTAYAYTTEIYGNIYNFSNTETISGLPDDNYEFCITVDGEDYEQCFSVVIDDGAIVGGKTTINDGKMSVVITEGTAPFTVFVNDKFQFQTSAAQFNINVVQGDTVEVKTSVACEGVIAKKVNLFDEIIAYPNPSNGFFEIAIPFNEKTVLVEIFNTQSQLISSVNYQITNGKIQLSLAGKSTGLYFVKLNLNEPKVLKVIKN